MTTLTDFDEIFKAFHTSPSKLIFLTFQIKKKKKEERILAVTHCIHMYYPV